MEKRKEIYLVAPDCSLKYAMSIIEENNHRCTIVVDNKNKVVGTLSDGDIRKYLLSNHLLTGKVKDVMNLNFRFLSEHNEAVAKEIFDKLHISLIPVVDDDGLLIDIIEAF